MSSVESSGSFDDETKKDQERFRRMLLGVGESATFT